MDEFFLSNEHALVDPDAPIPKRKRERMLEAAKAYIASQKKNQKGSTEVDDDDIASSESDNEPNLKRSLESDLEDEGSEVEKETPAQKRLRLAKQYLSKLKDELAQDENEEDADAAQIDRDLIADRLRDDAVRLSIFHSGSNP
jgi:ribosomal RNA-processing protein 9